MTPTHGGEIEKGWAVCIKCGTRRPGDALGFVNGLSSKRLCLDRAWCDAKLRGEK